MSAPARTVSISTAPYDGHAVPATLDSLAACGARHVEPAYIVGYTEPFDESAFTPAAAAQYATWLAASGLRCHAVSSHIDLGAPGAEAVFRRRMDFARRIGAAVINTNAAARPSAAGFARAIGPLAHHAENIGLRIGLENPGDGRDNLINTAADGMTLLATLGLPAVGLNCDAANTASHRPNLANPVDDVIAALDACVHLHLKDVRRTPQGWFFCRLGEGDLHLDRLLAGLTTRPDLPVSIEIPLRLHRTACAQPQRDQQPIALADIEAVLRHALSYVAGRLMAG